MSLSDKKIWIDLEQPKAAVMLTPLIKMFEKENAELLITARDYDSTYDLLDERNMDYIKIGSHGGASLENKLKTYIKRLDKLFDHVTKFKPDHFVNFISVDGVRIAYGLQIPSIGYNDEPRNIPVCKLIFPYIDNLITPQCIPKEWYIQLCADPKKIIRYNGIDEIAWLSEFNPNPEVLREFDLSKGKFVIMRTEPSSACYFINKLEPDETLLAEIFPPLFKEFPNYKYFLLVRNQKQGNYLKKKLSNYIDNENLIITQYLPNLDDHCFYSGLVISGGGTIVRESSLLGIPSIEFFPGETAPQEMFLMNNGFPLEHIEGVDRIIGRSIDILNNGPSKTRFNMSFRKKINQFENPNKIAYNRVKISLG